MIVIVSSSSRERSALASLCATRNWLTAGCESIRSATRLLARVNPRAVLIRHRLSDGFSDHLLAELSEGRRHPTPHRIVIVAAGTTSSAEARQIALGADCVLRDPLRTEVLMAYLEKFQRPVHDLAAPRLSATDRIVPFIGGDLLPTDRRLQISGRQGILTPREVELAELLVRDAGQVVTYETLYSEILNRRFSGDTSNLRVLLGKLAGSAASLGVNLREWVEVIPKTGYRYHQSARKSPVAPPPT